MATRIVLDPPKIYETIEELEKDVEGIDDHYRYVVCITDEGKFYPVFLGNDQTILREM